MIKRDAFIRSVDLRFATDTGRRVASVPTCPPPPSPRCSPQWNLRTRGSVVRSILARRGTTTQAAILNVLDGFDAKAYLLTAGVNRADIEVARSRLLR